MALREALLLLDTAAYMAVSAWFDHPGAAWGGAVFGYFCIGALSRGRGVAAEVREVGVLGRLQPALPLLAFASYTYHLFVLRWPWLTGAATADCRLSLWGASLSSTWQGLPLLAFGELLGLALIFLQAYLGVESALTDREGLRFTSRWRGASMTVAFIAYGLASSTVILLATGRR